jgi:hypothetical protein
MPDLPPISRLEIVDVREVWRHEAHVFTPWLAANLDRLAAVTGLQLELEDTEASVGTFSADILARDVQSGAMVIIENQLEGSDQSSFASTRSSIDSIRRHPPPRVVTSARAASSKAWESVDPKRLECGVCGIGVEARLELGEEFAGNRLNIRRARHREQKPLGCGEKVGHSRFKVLQSS